MAIEDISVTFEEENSIKTNTPDKLPLNPSAHGWSASTIRTFFGKAILMFLDLFKTKMNTVKTELESIQNELGTDVENRLTSAENNIVNIQNELDTDVENRLTSAENNIGSIQNELDTDVENRITNVENHIQSLEVNGAGIVIQAGEPADPYINMVYFEELN